MAAFSVGVADRVSAARWVFVTALSSPVPVRCAMTSPPITGRPRYARSRWTWLTPPRSTSTSRCANVSEAPAANAAAWLPIALVARLAARAGVTGAGSAAAPAVAGAASTADAASAVVVTMALMRTDSPLGPAVIGPDWDRAL